MSIRDEKVETIVIDAMAKRLLRPERLQQLLANLLDDSSPAFQARFKALRTERTRVESAIQTSSTSSSRAWSAPATSTSPLATPPAHPPRRSRTEDRAGRAAIVRHDRSVAPEAIGRLGEVIVRGPRFDDDAILRRGYVRRFIDNVMLAPTLITISGPIKPVEIAASNDHEHQTLTVPSSASTWCPTGDKLGTQIIGKFQ